MRTRLRQIMTGTKPRTVNCHPSEATNTKMFLGTATPLRANLKGLSAVHRQGVFMHGLLHVHKHTRRGKEFPRAAQIERKIPKREMSD